MYPPRFQLSQCSRKNEQDVLNMDNFLYAVPDVEACNKGVSFLYIFLKHNLLATV